MGLASFWSNITGPRVREITPRKNEQRAQDGRPATSSGVRTVRKTPSLEDERDLELNLVESLLTTNVIEPPPQTQTVFEKKEARRRSRGLSLSKSSSNEGGVKRRRSLFGGSKDTEPDKVDVPDVPRLPTLSAIYSAQAPHRLDDVDRPGTAISTFGRPASSKATENGQASGFAAASQSSQHPQPLANAVGEVFELPAELPTSSPAGKAKGLSKLELERRKSRRRSFGEVLSGKPRRSEASNRFDDADAPPTPALPVGGLEEPENKPSKSETARSRRNSNASVASKASKLSRKSRKKSWWRREKGKDEDGAIPPVPDPIASQTKATAAKDTKSRQTPSPADVDLSAFPTVPASKNFQEDDDPASVHTTRSQKDTVRDKPEHTKTKKRSHSTASHTRRGRRSWWTSSNPDNSDNDDPSNPLPPVPLLVRSATTTPESSPTNSDATYTAVRGENTAAPRPLSSTSNKDASGPYTPRSAPKSSLVPTTPASPNIRHSIRHSLHKAQEAGAGFETDRGTYCLSAEQQREWEKLMHVMGVMDQGGDVPRETFETASVGGSLGREGGEGEKDVEGGEVKFSNPDALAALEVGVAK